MYKSTLPITRIHSIENKVEWVNRVALAVVFVWFGFLKVIQKSPAEPLVSQLHSETISSIIPIELFLICFGLFECLIGCLWLFPRLTKIVFGLFLIQMTATFLPLAFLPATTWQQSFVLTLTGQYIVKNVVLIASGLTILLSHKT